MEKIIKLPQETLNAIAELQKQFVTVIGQLGDVEIGISNLNKAKAGIIEKYGELRENEKVIIDNIGKQFGYGRLNLEKGELTIEENVDKTE